MIVFRCLSHSSFGAPPPPLPLPLLLPLQPVSSSYNSESITCLRTCCGSLILTLLRNVFEQLLQQLRDGAAQHVWPYKSMQLACFSILLPFVFFLLWKQLCCTHCADASERYLDTPFPRYSNRILALAFVVVIMRQALHSLNIRTSWLVPSSIRISQ